MQLENMIEDIVNRKLKSAEETLEVWIKKFNSAYWEQISSLKELKEIIKF